MNEMLEILQSRRTIRRYKDAVIPKETLEKVLMAAQSTQSWHNSQCWECIVVTDPDQRKELQQTVPTKNSAFKAMVSASAVLCICGKLKTSGYFGDTPGSILGDWLLYDTGLMTQNICIQAHALGLGTVVVGWFDHEKAQDILSLPQGYQLISMLPIGYPDHQPSPPARKQLKEFVHINSFGNSYE